MQLTTVRETFIRDSWFKGLGFVAPDHDSRRDLTRDLTRWFAGPVVPTYVADSESDCAKAAV